MHVSVHEHARAISDVGRYPYSMFILQVGVGMYRFRPNRPLTGQSVEAYGGFSWAVQQDFERTACLHPPPSCVSGKSAKDRATHYCLGTPLVVERVEVALAAWACLPEDFKLICPLAPTSTRDILPDGSGVWNDSLPALTDGDSPFVHLYSHAKTCQQANDTASTKDHQHPATFCANEVATRWLEACAAPAAFAVESEVPGKEPSIGRGSKGLEPMVGPSSNEARVK